MNNGYNAVSEGLCHLHYTHYTSIVDDNCDDVEEITLSTIRRPFPVAGRKS